MQPQAKKSNIDSHSNSANAVCKLHVDSNGFRLVMQLSQGHYSQLSSRNSKILAVASSSSMQKACSNNLMFYEALYRHWLAT